MMFWILSREYSSEGLRTSACLALVRTWKHVCEGEISHSPHLDPNSPVKSPKMLSPSPREDVAKWAYPLFLPQKELFSSFCYRTNFSAMQQNFLLCNKASCYAVKLSAVN